MPIRNNKESKVQFFADATEPKLNKMKTITKNLDVVAIVATVVLFVLSVVMACLNANVINVL